ncbi:ribosome biogenesis regulatory protein homolog [Ischnura elegans]|uniref:ribosome biogenesis regulatory protein homolog n=1 Tax=Ischnura elegans TaxID=197161 RepID=UPI001ED868D1|nr:ribosome biogenesis regulatory protein homolog [Ischnura elegans]
MDIVAKVLEKAAEEEKKFKPISVNKPLDLEYDVGNFITEDKNDLNEKELRKDTDGYLKQLARDNTQLIINKIWELPTEQVEEVFVAKLPASTFVLPREKPVPKPKPLTKWQQYAKEKGIKKKKKDKLVWDEVVQKWVPNYGYKKASAQKEKDWVIEVPQSADPYEDQFSKKEEEKKERVAKNELKRLRNLAASKNIKVPKIGLLPAENPTSTHLNIATHLAKASTASLGKFQPKLPKEKLNSKSPLGPKKRKIDAQSITPKMERSSHLTIADSILCKKPKLDVEKAVNTELYNQDQEKAEEKKKPKKGAKKRTMHQGSKRKGGKGNKFKGDGGNKKMGSAGLSGGKGKGKSFGPKSSGKGQRIHKAKGRKRR